MIFIHLYYSCRKNNINKQLINIPYIKFEKDFNIGFTLGLYDSWFYKKDNSDKMTHGIHPEIFSKDEINVYMNNALKHITVEFHFESGILYFYDQLSFGIIKIFNEE